MSNKQPVEITIKGRTIKAYKVNRNLAGDFIGFTFDDKHSSDFNLVRVSNGSRYESNLLPSFQDATIQGEGKDGMYYFGSNFKEKPIKFSTAFDNLTEENYRDLAETFSDKKMHKLWFDETPYKAYYVKLKQSPTFKNLCFDEYYEEDGERKAKRIYRGEMDLEFVCYSVWAEARANHLNQVLSDEEFIIVLSELEQEGVEMFHNHHLTCQQNHELEEDQCSFEYIGKQFYKFYGVDGATLMDSYNANEWITASRLKNSPPKEPIETIETYERIEVSEGELIPIYNPGDKKADIKITFTPKEGENTNTYTFPSTKLLVYSEKNDQTVPILTMGIKSFLFGGEDMHIIIDSHTHLIEGLTVDKKLSGKVYNKYHIAGDFFEIPKSNYEDNLYLKIESSASGTWELEYKFYYV